MEAVTRTIRGGGWPGPLLLLLALPAGGAAQDGAAGTAGDLYRDACAACHGVDGTGAPQALVGFEVPLPDFTDCSFATREPDDDWLAVTHAGGPARAFDRLMPAFRDALTMEQMERVMDYVRAFCDDGSWPRGELNLPRPMFTEKAYPEDEWVWTTSAALEGDAAFASELVYERRFGARNQWEVAVPFGVSERAPGDWTGGFGDVALGVKRALWHSLESGSILSAAAEVIVPLGDEDDGFGAGTAKWEPFVAFGQILPAAAFLHLQAGAEIPWERDRAEDEAFWRLALGRSWVEGRWGRSWSPMVELLGARELASGATTLWDLVPQLQVTLSTRQHVMANLAVRLPLSDAGARDTQLLVYLLWDWFDGGLLEGW